MSLQPWKMPRYYHGERWDGFLVSPVFRTRDSDTVDESNFRVLLRQLRAVEEADTTAAMANNIDADDELCCGHVVVRENHFLVGWTEWIAISPHAVQSIALCEAAQTRLEEYVVLDEHDLGALEADMEPEEEEEDDDDDTDAKSV